MTNLPSDTPEARQRFFEKIKSRTLTTGTGCWEWQAEEPSRAKSAYVEDVPGRDPCTRADVDDRFRALIDFLYVEALNLDTTRRNTVAQYIEALDSFRRRFLP